VKQEKVKRLELNKMSYGRSPLNAMGTTDKVVGMTCHNDCIKHCHIETKSVPHCPEPACPPPCPPACPPPCPPACPPPCPEPCDPCAKPASPCGGWGWGALLVGFLVIFAITWLVLWLLKPEWVLKDCNKGCNNGGHGHGNSNVSGHPDHPKPPHGGGCKNKDHRECDTGKTLIAALLIALIIVIFIWIIRAVLCSAKC